MAQFKPVVFQVGSELYAVDIGIVQGIERKQNIVGIPNSVPYVKGIMNLRGDIVPVLSLRVQFNLEDVVSDQVEYVVVRIKDLLIALETDGVKEIHEIENTSLYDIPPIILDENTGYIKNIMNVDNKLIILLNVMNILTKKEQVAIEQMVKEAEK